MLYLKLSQLYEEISSMTKRLEKIDLVSKFLNTSEMPDPELVIRSGGEMRISNFLLWQIAYSEIYVTQVLWPKFKTSNLIEAINEFQRRERRFGLVSEQINEDKKKIGEND